MKIDWNKKYTTISVYAIIVIMISVLFVVAVFKMESFLEGLNSVVSIVMPLIIGLGIAYIMNPLVNIFEKRVFKKLSDKANTRRKKHLIRGISVFIVVILVLLLISVLIVVIAQPIAQSVLDITKSMPQYVKEFQEWVSKTSVDYPDIAKMLATPIQELDKIVDDFMEWIAPFQKNIYDFVSTGVLGVVVGFKNFIIGFIIAVYLLYSKDMFVAQSKKILFAMVKTERSFQILEVLKRSHKIFLRSITAMLIDSLVVGIITTVAMLIMGMPYPTLIGAIVGVTNLIPFFGPFLGAIPGGLIILMASEPIKVLWFAIFIVIMQQIDGNIIMPRIQGDSTGIPAIWVLVSITVGGGLFGVLGMLLAVPTFAVFYMLIRLYIECRLENKHLPSATDAYSTEIDHLKDDIMPGK